MVLKGADYLVESASSIARRFNTSEIVIGLTIVAFGTSAPEMVVNIISSLAGNNEIVLGNIIGSNIFNTLLILGIAGLIYPLKVQRNTARKEIPFNILVLLIFFFIANDWILFPSSSNMISRLDGLILLVLFAGFVYYTYMLSKSKTFYASKNKTLAPLKTWIFLVLGLVGLLVGGKIVVDTAVSIARQLKVSEKLIALTIISMGTSLPELATSAVAAYKKRPDLAIGNVIGSNIFNLLMILGFSAEISPLKYNLIFNFDLAIFGLAMLILFLSMFTFKANKLDRVEALFLVLVYTGYLVYIIVRK